MFQISSLFAVPMVEAQHPDSQSLNQQLRTLFLQRESEGSRYANDHPTMGIKPGLFESDFTVFAWPEPPIAQLREFCWASLSRAIAQVNGFGPERMNQLLLRSHTWFHITRRGGRFDFHNHPMASWSGVYCVDPGDPVPGDPESGALTFVNPLGIANMFADPANTQLRRPYALGNLAYPMTPGRLVLFPSWLQHYVQPYAGERERITVAFNCWVETAEATSGTGG